MSGRVSHDDPVRQSSIRMRVLSNLRRADENAGLTENWLSLQISRIARKTVARLARRPADISAGCSEYGDSIKCSDPAYHRSTVNLLQCPSFLGASGSHTHIYNVNLMRNIDASIVKTFLFGVSGSAVPTNLPTSSH